MRNFILRALKGKTTPDFDINNLPEAGRLDLVCRCVSNALFISNDVRKDTIIYVVLDGPSSPPKTISFVGAELKGMEFDEKNIAEHIKLALEKGKNLKLNESTESSSGIKISKKGFEQLVKEKAVNSQLIYLHEKGEDIRKANFKENVTFIFGDYIGMPRKTELFLERFKPKRINLSPKTLFASHCITIVHNELDRKEK